MQLKAICYLSTPVRDLNNLEIDTLLSSAICHNRFINVTGVLLYDKTNFFQYFEGHPDTVEKLYEKIKNASQHNDIQTVFDQRIPKRYFNEWHMGFCDAPQSFLQELANANWLANMHVAENNTSESEGLSMLVDFWEVFTSNMFF